MSRLARVSPIPGVLAPAQIVQGLERRIHGHQRAKELVAAAGYRHSVYRGLRQRGRSLAEFGLRRALLLAGPTGSGKTQLVQALGEVLGVETYRYDVSNLSEAGYKGGDVDSILTGLVQYAGTRASDAVLFLDEIDKKADPQPGELSVSRLGVQQALLKLIEAGQFYVPALERSFDTSGLLVILAGAFQGVPDLIHRRLESSRTGAAPTFADPYRLEGLHGEAEELYPHLVPQDLIDYGMLPELVGRCTLVPLAGLSLRDLYHLFKEGEASPLRQVEAWFRLHGVELTFSDDALYWLAQETRARGLGVRGAQSLLEAILAPLQFHLPELAAAGERRLHLTEETLRTGCLPAASAEAGRAERCQRPGGAERTGRPAPGDPPAPPAPPGEPEPEAWGALRLPTALHLEDRTLSQIWKELDEEHQDLLQRLRFTEPAARCFWLHLEGANPDRRCEVERLAVELSRRGLTIPEFYRGWLRVAWAYPATWVTVQRVLEELQGNPSDG